MALRKPRISTLRSSSFSSFFFVLRPETMPRKAYLPVYLAFFFIVLQINEKLYSSIFISSTFSALKAIALVFGSNKSSSVT